MAKNNFFNLLILRAYLPETNAFAFCPVFLIFLMLPKSLLAVEGFSPDRLFLAVGP
jgi:hypothetical protein